MKLSTILEGIVLGAGLMYILDPESGRRRQSMAKDQLQRQLKHKQEALNVMQKDFMNRSRGLATQIRSARTRGDVASDEIVQARIRSAVGRICSHPRAIHCEVHNGEVILAGMVLPQERERVVECAQRTKGVHLVTDNLDLVEDPSHVPSMQGQTTIAQSSMMNPAMGLVMLSVGGLLTSYGLLRRGLVGSLCTVAGLGMAAKAFSDTESRYQPGANPSSSAIAAGGAMSEKQEESLEGFQGVYQTDEGAINQIAALPATPEDNSGMI